MHFFRLITLLILSARAFAAPPVLPPSVEAVYTRLACSFISEGSWPASREYLLQLKYWLATNSNFEDIDLKKKAADSFLKPVLQILLQRAEAASSIPGLGGDAEESRSQFISLFAHSDKLSFPVRTIKSLAPLDLERLYQDAMIVQKKYSVQLASRVKKALRSENINLEMISGLARLLTRAHPFQIYTHILTQPQTSRSESRRTNAYVQHLLEDRSGPKPIATIFSPISKQQFNKISYLIHIAEVVQGLGYFDDTEGFAEALYDHDLGHYQDFVIMTNLHYPISENSWFKEALVALGITGGTLTGIQVRLLAHAIEWTRYEKTRLLFQGTPHEDLLVDAYFDYWHENPDQIYKGFEAALREMNSEADDPALSHVLWGYLQNNALLPEKELIRAILEFHKEG